VMIHTADRLIFHAFLCLSVSGTFLFAVIAIDYVEHERAASFTDGFKAGR
jgi:hypothetical protein